MWRDDGYLLDMLKAARRCCEYASALTLEELKRNSMCQDAIFRTLEIIGMRNRLIHEYFRISIERVWETATVDIPPLIKLLEQAAPPE